MIKVCSLDFLNRDVFETDIMGKNGTVLFPTGSVITPEILLNLYFKEIYVDDNFFEEEEKKDALAKQVEANVDVATRLEKNLESTTDSKETERKIYSAGVSFAGKVDTKSSPRAAAFSASMRGSESDIDNDNAAEVEKKEAPAQLEFDEVKAKRVSGYATNLGKSIGIPESELKELEQAAYYYTIGRKMFTTEDLGRPGFKKKQAAASYNILLNEMDFPKKIADVAKDYIEKYEPNNFKLDKPFLTNIPHAHIVAIIDFYDELLSTNLPKNEVLEKMLQLGGSRFNIFVLHKFVSMMRN